METVDFKLNVQLHGNQEKVHHHPARFKAIKAGKRFGKSHWAGFELVQMAFRNPGVYWYIAPTIGQAREIMWDYLKGVIPPALIIGNPLNTDLEINLNLFSRGSSKIKLKGTDNETSLRGPGISGGIMDEAAYDETKGYAWPNIIRGQLAKSKGPFYLISSPHKNGKNWYTKLCEDWEKRMRAGDPDYAYWHFTIYDNPTLDRQEIEAIRDGCTDDKWNLEYMAKESDYGGILYNEFSYARHVSDKAIPKDVIWVRAIDWGIDHPTTCLWLAVDCNAKHIYVADEFYKTDYKIKESAAAIKLITGDKSIAWTVIDPSTKKRNSQTDRSDQMEFHYYGVPTIPGDNNDRGYDITKLLFKENSITVHPKCKNLIAELSNYQRDDKEGDDCLDPLRYACVRIRDTVFGGNIQPVQTEKDWPTGVFDINGPLFKKRHKAKSFSWAYGGDDDDYSEAV